MYRAVAQSFPLNLSASTSLEMPSKRSTEPPIACHQAWILSKTPNIRACLKSITPSPAHGVAKMASGFSAMTAEIWDEKSIVKKGAQAAEKNSTSGRNFLIFSLNRFQAQYPYS